MSGQYQRWDSESFGRHFVCHHRPSCDTDDVSSPKSSEPARSQSRTSPQLLLVNRLERCSSSQVPPFTGEPRPSVCRQPFSFAQPGSSPCLLLRWQVRLCSVERCGNELTLEVFDVANPGTSKKSDNNKIGSGEGLLISSPDTSKALFCLLRSDGKNLKWPRCHNSTKPSITSISPSLQPQWRSPMMPRH